MRVSKLLPFPNLPALKFIFIVFFIDPSSWRSLVGSCKIFTHDLFRSSFGKVGQKFRLSKEISKPTLRADLSEIIIRRHNYFPDGFMKPLKIP